MLAKTRRLIPGLLPVHFRPIGVAALALLIGACSTMRATSDYDRSANFSQYKTYAWMPRQHTEVGSAVIVRRAREAIDWELHRKGFTLAQDPNTADFVADFRIAAQKRVDVESRPIMYRQPWHWGRWYYGSPVYVRRFQEGTIAVDIFDGHTHEAVWSGQVRKQLSESDLEQPGPALHKAVAAVLAQFPPA